MAGKHVAAPGRVTRAKYSGTEPAAANDIPPGATVVTTAAQLSHIVRSEVLAALEEAGAARPAPDLRLLDRQALADALRVAPGTVDVLRRRGMPCRRIGDSPRFDLNACLDWIDADQAVDGA